MSIRDDAITIKELMKRAKTNRTKVFKSIIQEWQKDHIKKDFIFQVDKPNSRTGKMWLIKKPAVSLAIQTLISLSESKQQENKTAQEQQTITEQNLNNQNKTEQEQPEQEMNKEWIGYLKHIISNQQNTIDDLKTEMIEMRKDHTKNFELIVKRLPAPKIEDEATPEERETDRMVQQERRNKELEQQRQANHPQLKPQQPPQPQPQIQLPPKKKGIMDRIFG